MNPEHQLAKIQPCSLPYGGHVVPCVDKWNFGDWCWGCLGDGTRVEMPGVNLIPNQEGGWTEVK